MPNAGGQVHHVRTEFVGYLLRYRLHAADHTLIEQDALVDEVLELPRRGNHQHGLQYRE
ncbi:Uncharacterised protein [Mycobacteroides abscessus subsp. abscessus]|nr:Uncharacterised protein [Mycobacteroides abscessus subsp. abscessus]